MYYSLDVSHGLRASVARQYRVILAIMLRNIRTRFFGHGFGFLVGIAWPVVHTAIVIALFSIGNRAAPAGDSVVLFVGIGSIQFMTFSYLSR